MNNKFVITVSYGNHMTGVGGTDKALLTHQSLLNNAGIDVVSLYSFSKRGVDNLWNVLFNGEPLGVFSNYRLKRFIEKKTHHGIVLYGVFIHHLKSINLFVLSELLEYCQVPIYFFIHDYHTICPDRGLVGHNDIFCGNGFPCDEKCLHCSDYDVIAERAKRIRDFLKSISNRTTFIAPSDTAKEIWTSDYKEFEEQTIVLYHQRVIGQYCGNNKIIDKGEKLRIAFVGYQVNYKGWHRFVDAAKKACEHQLNEEFFQFGWGKERYHYITQVDVDFKISLSAMMDMLRDYKIHCAVLWSTIPETYSYTFYESLASNCYILTNPKSGNIAFQVKERSNGCITDDLTEVICGETDLRERINSFRNNGHVTPSELVDSDDFISLLYDCGWKPEKNRRKIDLSGFYSILDNKKLRSLLNKVRKLRK